MKAVVALLLSVCLLQLHFAFVSSTMSLFQFDCGRGVSIPVEASDESCSESSVPVDAETLDELQSGYQQAYLEWWSQGKKACDVDSITAAAKGLSNVIANFSTLVASDVVCSGDQRFACGWSFVKETQPEDAFVLIGDTFVQVEKQKLLKFIGGELLLAKARALGSLILGFNKEGAAMGNGFCDTDGHQIAEGFFQAAGNASREACAFSGEDAVSHYTGSFAMALEPLVFEALFSAINETCSTEGAGCTSSRKYEDVPVLGEDEFGRLCQASSFTPMRPCSGLVADICCEERERRCRIPRDMCGGCLPYRQIKEGNFTLYMESRNREPCLCDGI